jgi:Ca2+-binding EF-hand superfamily protein
MKTNKTAVSTISIMATAVALMGAPVFASQDKADITRADALEMAGKRFDKVDTDGDGVLTAQERKAAHSGKHRDEKRHDKKDGHKRGDMFSKIDADGSGDVTAEEFSVASERMAEHRAKMRDGQNDDKPEGKPKPSPAERFEKLDTDADGVLSKDELSAGKRGHKGKTEDK